VACSPNWKASRPRLRRAIPGQSRAGHTHSGNSDASHWLATRTSTSDFGTVPIFCQRADISCARRGGAGVARPRGVGITPVPSGACGYASIYSRFHVDGHDGGDHADAPGSRRRAHSLAAHDCRDQPHRSLLRYTVACSGISVRRTRFLSQGIGPIGDRLVTTHAAQDSARAMPSTTGRRCRRP